MFTFQMIWIWYGFLVLVGLLLFIALAQIITSFRHGSRMPLNILVSGIFVVGIAAILIITLSLLGTTDWSTNSTITPPSVPFLKF